MPVEIKELVIRAIVDGEPGQPRPHGRPLDREEREALVQACVDETLRVLRRRQGR